MHDAIVRTNIASWVRGHGCHKAMISPNGNVELATSGPVLTVRFC